MTAKFLLVMVTWSLSIHSEGGRARLHKGDGNLMEPTQGSPTITFNRSLGYALFV